MRSLLPALLVAAAFVATSPFSYGGGQNAAHGSAPREKAPVHHNEVEIDGRTIDYISLALGAYVKSRPDESSDIADYTFTIVEETRDEICIDLMSNDRLIPEELREQLSRRGGGARYYIDKKRHAITSRVFFK